MAGFARIKNADVAGVSFAYSEVGGGEAVVFVHGGLSDLRTWEQQLEPVGASYRAIAYSRRYARPNDDILPGTDDQLLPHVDDLVAFLDTIGAVPAHLVGNSWGAFICLLTALKHPESVRTLVLEEPPLIPLFLGPGMRPKPSVVLANLLRRPRPTLQVLSFGGPVMRVQKAFRRGDDELALQTFIHAVLGKDAYERLPSARKQQMRDNLSALKAQMLGRGFPPLSPDDLRRVRVPTLLLTGEHSPPLMLAFTDRLEQLLPHADRHEIPAASHAMHEENASAVNAAILDFLARQAAPKC